MNTVAFLSEERKLYYKSKKARQSREKRANLAIEDDALFIKHYGMSALLELFPEARRFGFEYHQKIIVELERMENKQMAQWLSGIAMAIAATKYKKSNSRFTQMIKSLRK